MKNFSKVIFASFLLYFVAIFDEATKDIKNIKFYIFKKSNFAIGIGKVILNFILPDNFVFFFNLLNVSE